ncbi:hypothetical protein AURDEDRAFT_143188 [Auricularia subglabra TFB-10046 SS5]|nr:hypothetical protein AURDEDRAFT_143188 [Auricularia subglabra TFB-10046 SS5]
MTAVKFTIPASVALKTPAKPYRPPKDPFPDSDDNVPTTPAKPVRTAKPPVLAFTHVAAAPTTPAKSLRAAKPPLLATPAPKQAPTPMRALKPPPLPQPSPEPTKQRLRAPVLPALASSDGPASSSFRPLSTTRLALATTEELARTRDPDADDPEKRALVRGMDLSPQKPSKFRRSSSKSALADIAKQVIDRESVALHLWQQETRVVRDARRLGPALTVTVRALLQRNEHSGAPSVPRGALATCALPDGSERTFFFSASGDAIRGMSPVEVQEGARVMVWEPWIELRAPPDEVKSNNDDPFSAAAADSGDARAPVLLCSRFVVAR